MCPCARMLSVWPVQKTCFRHPESRAEIRSPSWARSAENEGMTAVDTTESPDWARPCLSRASSLATVPGPTRPDGRKYGTSLSRSSSPTRRPC